jgi:hypothetical protein
MNKTVVKSANLQQVLAALGLLGAGGAAGAGAIHVADNLRRPRSVQEKLRYMVDDNVRPKDTVDGLIEWVNRLNEQRKTQKPQVKDPLADYR